MHIQTELDIRNLFFLRETSTSDSANPVFFLMNKKLSKKWWSNWCLANFPREIRFVCVFLLIWQKLLNLISLRYHPFRPSASIIAEDRWSRIKIGFFYIIQIQTNFRFLPFIIDFCEFFFSKCPYKSIKWRNFRMFSMSSLLQIDAHDCFDLDKSCR